MQRSLPQNTSRPCSVQTKLPIPRLLVGTVVRLIKWISLYDWNVFMRCVMIVILLIQKVSSEFIPRRYWCPPYCYEGCRKNIPICSFPAYVFLLNSDRVSYNEMHSFWITIERMMILFWITSRKLGDDDFWIIHLPSPSKKNYNVIGKY